MRQVLTGTIFDGALLRPLHSLVLEDGRIAELRPASTPPTFEGILAPGLLDLQVNGGGGLMVDGATTAVTLRDICATHESLGTLGVLPTLITDTAEATRAVIAATIAAAGTTGLLGLHLEGPHLDPRRKGAHDPALIRPLEDDDLALYCDAARRLPTLLVTLAPEAATPEQISTLTQAGAIVSLGHSGCTCAKAMQAIQAGASCITHLFNAMSPLGHREPGLAGAALSSPLATGLIADGVHVDPTVLKIALAAKPEGMFLISDCMAPAGTHQTEFRLNGRRILRRDGRLVLEDGTLAGADLTLPQALRTLLGIGVPVDRALAMATAAPAAAIRRGQELGHLAPGRPADLVLFSQSLHLLATWRGGLRTDRPSRS